MNYFYRHTCATMSEVCEILGHSVYKMLHHTKQRNSMHLQTVMQAIVICNSSRRSNSYTIYTCTLCWSMKIKLDRLRVKIAQATSDNGIQLDEEMHDDMLNMLQLSTSVVESAHTSVQVPKSCKSRRSVSHF